MELYNSEVLAMFFYQKIRQRNSPRFFNKP